MISDNGPQFKSAEFSKFCEEIGTELRHSTPYFPRMNGEVERMNRLIKKILQISYNRGSEWWDDLQRFLLTYRTTLHTVTGVEPARLMLGHIPRDKIPTMQEVERTIDHELADRDRMVKEKGKAQADARLRARPIDLQVGDEVIVKRVKKNSKLSSNYNPTVCKVINRRGGETTAVTDKGERVTRNVSHFKRFYRPRTEPQTLSHTRLREEQETDNVTATLQLPSQAVSTTPRATQPAVSGIVPDTTPLQQVAGRTTSSVPNDSLGFSGFLPQINSTPAISQCRGEGRESDIQVEDQGPRGDRHHRFPRRDRRPPKRFRDSNHAE